MTKIFTGITAALLLVIGLMYWQMTSLEKTITDQAETIGIQAQFMAQQTQTINDIELDKKNLKAEKAAAEIALVEAKESKQKLAQNNSLLKSKIGVLESEKAEIKDYLSGIIPPDLIVMFNLRKNEAGYYYEDGVCRTSTSIDDANDCPIFTTKSLVNYALDYQAALDSCNYDKKGWQDWWNKVQVMNHD